MRPSLSELISAVRQRADMVASEYVTDSEVTSYINQSYFELYDLLIQKFGNNYYVALPHEFSTTGVDNQFPLPSDFYKLLGVDCAISNTAATFISLKPFSFADRNKYTAPNFQAFHGITNMRYRLNGDRLWLMPQPAGGQIIRVWYVPRAVKLTLLTDTVDGVSGWDEYIVCDAAMKCLQKEESDVSVLMAEKAALIHRINSAAENRDAGAPAVVSDSLRMDSWTHEGEF